MTPELFWSSVLSGGIALAYFIAGLFFLRFWARTRDRLFLFFAISFWLLMLERLLLVQIRHTQGFLPESTHESVPYIYTVRLVAFLVILGAIIDKNRSRSG